MTMRSKDFSMRVPRRWAIIVRLPGSGERVSSDGRSSFPCLYFRPAGGWVPRSLRSLPHPSSGVMGVTDGDGEGVGGVGARGALEGEEGLDDGADLGLGGAAVAGDAAFYRRW